MKAAEQARLAYLGANQAECVPWAELKPEMRERWQRVVGELESLRAELAAVTAERDAANERAEQAEAEAADLRCESSLIGELRTILGLGWCESITERCRDLSALRQGDAGERRGLEQEIATERDKANRFDATAQGLSEIVDGQKRDKDSLRPQLDAAQAECKHLNAVIADMQPVGATPTDAQVEALARVLYEAWGASGEMTYPVSWRNSARAAYAHIGRVQVGCELDLTAEQAYKQYVNGDGRPLIAMQAVIDLCRSRIRPTYECKECAKRPKNVVTSFNFTFNYDTGTWQAVNCAALEGE